MNSKRKQKIALGVCGNVDSGKSTLAGHLLSLTGYTTEHEQKKLLEFATKTKDSSFQYAFKMDTLKEERERGVTIKETLAEFSTPNRDFIISDLPGHTLFTKNFLVGSSQLDLALILIDVHDGVVDQTKGHLRIVLGNGVKNIIAVVNKMDRVSYEEKPFRDIQEAFTKLVGDRVNYLEVIPLSAFEGENILKNSKMPWYEGKTLYDLLDSVPIPELPLNSPLRFHVSEIVNKTGIGLIVQGKVSRGILRKDSQILIKPTNKKYEVKTIEAFHKSIDEAYPNDSVGITIRGLNKDDIKKGYVISSVDNAPKNAKEMDLEITVIHPQVKLKEASDLLMSVGTALVAVKIKKIYEIRDKQGEIIFNESSKEPSKTQEIVRGQSAFILVKPSRIIVAEKGEDNPKLGVCALLNEKGLVASAVIMNITVDESDA